MREARKQISKEEFIVASFAKIPPPSPILLFKVFLFALKLVFATYVVLISASESMYEYGVVPGRNSFHIVSQMLFKEETRKEL